MKRFIKIACIFCVFACIGLTATAGHAYTITETQKLSFGTFAPTRNDGAYSITVHPNGTVDYDPEIVYRTEGERGIYTFTDLPANVTFYISLGATPNPPTQGGITIDNSTGLTSGGNPPFIIDNFTASDLVTDSNGDGVLYIGATLTTNGSGINYTSGNYTGTADLILHY